MMAARPPNETQDEKRQRLREAGKKKLEEFKRRNVDLLPGPSISSTRAYDPVTGAFLGVPTPRPQTSLPMNMMDVGRALPGWSFQIKRASTPLPPPEAQTQQKQPQGAGPIAREVHQDMDQDRAGLRLPPSDDAVANQRDGDATSSPLLDATSHAGATSSDSGKLDNRTDSGGGGGSGGIQGSASIRPTYRPIQTPTKASAPSRGEEETDARYPESGMDADNPLVLMLIQQVKGMKEEKQELLRQLEELCAENGNLQELVGFLTEGADLRADPSGDYSGEYQGESDEQYGSDIGELYGQLDHEVPYGNEYHSDLPTA